MKVPHRYYIGRSPIPVPGWAMGMPDRPWLWLRVHGVIQLRPRRAR